MLYSLLADLVLILHFSIVLFVIGGLIIVIIGNLLQWKWVNNLWFRSLHLAVIAMVMAQSFMGEICPLTELEMWLRLRAGQPTYSGGFFQHWISEVLFYHAPSWVFMAAYTLFGLLVMYVWRKFPPDYKWRGKYQGD